MIHEAVVWSELQKKWFFLPRKASKSKYNDVDDERHGTNLLIVAGLRIVCLIY
jgi:soluble calcium-activated nucleotidase 1